MRSCLIVEDSATIRRVLRDMLRRLGIANIEAKTAEEALAICGKTLPDAIIVDWNLPGMDGIALVRHIRALPAGGAPKILMCTVENSTAQIQRALDQGADEYIMKPFTLEALADKLTLAGIPLEGPKD